MGADLTMRPQEEFGLSVSDDHDLSRSEGLGLLAAKPKATRDAQAVDAKKILSGVWRKPGRNSGRASAQVRGSERVRPARALWGITSPTASERSIAPTDLSGVLPRGVSGIGRD